MSLVLYKNYPVDTICDAYDKKKISFPLIRSVLEGNQDGSIYGDLKHNNYLIVHKFGFADLIENEQSDDFDLALLKFFKDKKFLQDKLRLYNASEKWADVLQQCDPLDCAFVERVQMCLRLKVVDSFRYHSQDVSIEMLCNSNFDFIEESFDLSLGKRFWSSKEQFLRASFGVVIYVGTDPAVVCYACAISNNKVEVDIFTNPLYRAKGLAKFAVSEFIDICLSKGLMVNWDCYANNIPSFSLANYFGFEQVARYKHIILTK